MNYTILFIALLVLFNCGSQNSNSAHSSELHYNQFSMELDSSIKEIFESYNLQSGLAIGIIHKDKVVLSKGYGYSNLEEQLKMSETTPFYIASTTKSFLALLAGILEEKGEIDLNKSLKYYLPDVDLNIAYKEEDITIMDLITHTHGINNLPAQWISAFLGYDSSQQLFEIINKASTERDNREFGYSNLGTIITAIVLEKVTGKSWQNLLKEYIFEPLEMNNTSCNVSDYSKKQLAHTIDLNAEPNSYFDKQDNTMHPAGGAISTVQDMLKYLSVFTNKGKFKGQVYISEKLLAQLQDVHAEQDRNFGPIKREAYGLGLDIAIFNGEKHISRFGGFQGLASQMSFMPDHELAVVSFGNGLNNRISFFSAELAYNIYLKKENTNEMLQLALNDMGMRLSRADSIAALPNDPFSISYKHQVEDVVGIYTNDIWGTCEINLNSETLYGNWKNISGKIRVYEDSLYLLENRVANRVIQFVQNDGEVVKLINGSIEFTKQN